LAAGGTAPNFIRHAINRSRAFVAVRFEPPMKDGFLGVATSDANASEAMPLLFDLAAPAPERNTPSAPAAAVKPKPRAGYF
jgi:hypothetical protein